MEASCTTHKASQSPPEGAWRRKNSGDVIGCRDLDDAFWTDIPSMQANILHVNSKVVLPFLTIVVFLWLLIPSAL
jgi:hypothetical protein